MNMMLLGILIGAGSMCLLYLAFTVSRLHTSLIFLHQSNEALSKATNVILVKLAKIEKVTDTTMTAAENFVDALRESTEQMMMRPPIMGKNFNNSQQFDDLHQAFDEGIRGMEDQNDEEDPEDEGEDQDNKWKL